MSVYEGLTNNFNKLNLDVEKKYVLVIKARKRRKSYIDEEEDFYDEKKRKMYLKRKNVIQNILNRLRFIFDIINLDKINY